MKPISNIVVLLFIIVLCSCSQRTLEPSQEQQKLTQSITVQGQAQIINGAKLLARKQAFQNAIRNVYAQLDGKTDSTSLIGSSKVVDEWVEDDVYFMQVLTVVGDAQTCRSPYRKRIVATGFPSVTSGQISANESQDLYSGIPREIMNILMEKGQFIGYNDTHTVLYESPDRAPDMVLTTDYSSSMVVDMAQQRKAQFVLSGVIRDFEIESTEYNRGAGLFSEMKSLMRDFIARRSIAIDVYVHDGLTGALLFQHRYTDTVTGDVFIPSGYTVGSERFKSTPAGHKISNIINTASQEISSIVSCFPFSRHVVKVDNNKVYFSAGLEDNLKQGDKLVVYASNSHGGFEEQQLIGVIKVMDVQRDFSVGEMEIISDARKIKSGDLVKNW